MVNKFDFKYRVIIGGFFLYIPMTSISKQRWNISGVKCIWLNLFQKQTTNQTWNLGTQVYLTTYKKT